MHNQTYIATLPTKELKLGSGGDKGGGGFYEELMTGRQGAGFVDQFGGAVFEVLEDLFHIISRTKLLQTFATVFSLVHARDLGEKLKRLVGTACPSEIFRYLKSPFSHFLTLPMV